MSKPDDDHECFDLDGARVHGDPNMPPELREALRQVIAAARIQLEAEQHVADPESPTQDPLRPSD